MSWNLPDGCSDMDIERAMTDVPLTEKEAKKEIRWDIATDRLLYLLGGSDELARLVRNSREAKEAILSELEDEITDEEIEQELNDFWEFTTNCHGTGWVRQ